MVEMDCEIWQAIEEILDMLNILRRAGVRALCKGGDDFGALWDKEDRDIEKRIAVLRSKMKERGE